VRDGHRDGAQADHAAYVEALDDLAHGAGEALPADVGLGPREEEVGLAAGVLERTDDQARRLVALVVVADEGDGRSPGAVVVEGVDVEGGDDATLRQRPEVTGGDLRGLARVEEAGEHDHHREPAGVDDPLDVVDDVHQPGGF
jgi:hypothetical protein